MRGMQGTSKLCVQDYAWPDSALTTDTTPASHASMRMHTHFMCTSTEETTPSIEISLRSSMVVLVPARAWSRQTKDWQDFTCSVLVVIIGSSSPSTSGNAAMFEVFGKGSFSLIKAHHAKIVRWTSACAMHAGLFASYRFLVHVPREWRRSDFYSSTAHRQAKLKPLPRRSETELYKKVLDRTFVVWASLKRRYVYMTVYMWTQARLNLCIMYSWW